MTSSIKVGSVLRVPVPSTWSVTSKDPTIVEGVISAGEVMLTAKRIGQTSITVSPWTDFHITLDLTVTPA